MRSALDTSKHLPQAPVISVGTSVLDEIHGAQRQPLAGRPFTRQKLPGSGGGQGPPLQSCCRGSGPPSAASLASRLPGLLGTGEFMQICSEGGFLQWQMKGSM